MKTTITPAERLQLIGLLALAGIHDTRLQEIRNGINELLGAVPAERDLGHVDDAVYDSNRRDADQLLERMNITVQE